MNLLFRRLAIVCLLSLLAAGCRKKEDPVAVIEEAEASLPPAEQLTPPVPTPREVERSAPTVEAAAAVQEPLPPASEDAYVAWFAKHQLDLNDPKMLDADSDSDGASNRDEFLADTNPHDPQSRPGLHQEMRLKEYTEVRLPVVLESVEGDTARIKRLDGGERVETVKRGETIKGLRWKVEKMSAKKDTDKEGNLIDVSNLTLTDPETNERAMLMKDLPTRTSDSFAEITTPGGGPTLKVRQDQVFRWPNANGTEFKVVDLREDQVIVQELATRKMWTIPRQ